jgi:polar amino acid transport system permease protein
LQGALITLELSILAQVMGVILGLVAALGRTSRNPVLYVPANFYIWFFRGTPVLVQLLFWYTALPQLIPSMRISEFQSALLGLGINEGAYMAEIVRAGILSVDKGQMEAAQSLGMTYGLAMRRIILPQALRVIIPPTGNEFISMLKTSSLASVVAVDELLQRAQSIYAVNFRNIELLSVAAIYYLFMTSVFSIGQAWLESRLGDRRAEVSRWWRNPLGILTARRAGVPNVAGQGGRR